MNNPNNPFNIPDLTVMYRAVVDYVLEHQGDKGYIDTHDGDADTIWTIVYTGYDSEYMEHPVAAVRVKGNTLQILYDDTDFYYYHLESKIEAALDVDWCSVMFDDNVVFLNTIFSIAETIQEYVEE